MSISQSLQNALSGLNANARAAEIVSANLANVMTEGYGPRQLELSSMNVGGHGAGVRIDGVVRLVDRGLLADRRISDADHQRNGMLHDAFVRMEDALGGIDDAHSIGSRVGQVEQALIFAASDPSSDQRLRQVVSGFDSLATTLNTASDSVQQMREEADASIASQVDTLNRTLRNVEALNGDISRALNSGYDATALFDQRQRLVDEISGIVPLRQMDRSNGQIALMTTTGFQLVDGTSAEIEFTPTAVITPDMTYGSGALSGLTIDGVPFPSGEAAGPFEGGTLGAAFELRDQELVGVQDHLDAVARDLIERFQDPAVDPSLGATDAGLLTDRGAQFDVLDTVGLAGRISINPNIDPNQGGLLSRLRDGVQAATVGPVGDTSMLNGWLSALQESRSLHTGGMTGSAASHGAAVHTSIGAMRINQESDVAVSSARWGALKNAELANGVDTDYEMQRLLVIEESYAANAKVIQTINSLMQTLMEI